MIYANIDSPADDERVGGQLVLSGWATSNDKEIVRIECFVDGRFRGAFRVGAQRIDVLTSGIPGATEKCGFRGKVKIRDLSSGAHALRVVVYDAGHASIAIDRRFMHVEDVIALEPVPATTERPRIIAFYLPQFHPIPENSAWWGPGFTEWTNVARGRPLYKGHHQPHVPADLGFYDLRLPEARLAQAQLARAHEIHGFAYYYYWFGGKRLLERPLDEVLRTQSPQFPFCVCYANENWTRRWDGMDREVLIAQQHSADDDRAFVRSLLHAFSDDRYIRVEGRPLLLVYRPSLLPDARRTAEVYRKECVNAGLPEPFLAYIQSFAADDPRAIDFDAAVEFPPLGYLPPGCADDVGDLDPAFRGSVHNYEDLIDMAEARTPPPFTLFRGVTPSWDNTARTGLRGVSFVNASPDGYRRWLEYALLWTQHYLPPTRQIVFVNAWNEWAEGCHLEPDLKYGRLYLDANRSAFERRVHGSAARTRKRLTVIIPSYNHEQFISGALDSALAQTMDDLDVVLVDDGSSDGTIAAAQAFLRTRVGRNRVTVCAQANAGAPAAIARGMEEARGDFVAILNSDDAYEPERMEVLLGALESQGADLAFSRVRYYDENDHDVTQVHGYARRLFEKQLEATSYPDIIYALLDFNVSISTGNFVFRRALYDRVGGFVPLVLTHDWHFVLSACRKGKVIYVPRDLYRYRIHGNNSYRGYGAFGELEGRIVMRDFFADTAAVKALRDKDERYYREFVRARNLQPFGADVDWRTAAIA